jgi:hypothetical protein
LASDQDSRNPRPLDFEERRVLLGLTPERAAFLAACSHVGAVRDANTKRIPYDPLVLIREAARMGISRKDTADMMQMRPDELDGLGVSFPPATTKLLAPGNVLHNLFTYDPADNE